MKKTKIVCTLGPASSSESIIKKMLEAGMNVARMNFSHGSHEEHRQRLLAFRRACEQTGCPATVMLDTKGPEIRLGDFAQGSADLKAGQLFTLSSSDLSGSAERCSISYSSLVNQVSIGTVILIDDGKIRMKVEGISDGDIICRVITPGKVSSHKGVNVPDLQLDMDYLSPADKKDLLFAVEEDVDYIAASFVRSEHDINCLRDFLNQNGGSHIKVISKIENPEGIRNFDSILNSSDGIMIARGDMGVELDYASIPGIQKTFIRKCCLAGKPVITATQMLDSMMSNTTPTRAEIADVANAVFDGSSAVMLSGESAAGKYPVETVEAMSRILARAEEDDVNLLSWASLTSSLKDQQTIMDLSTAIGHAACTTADDIGAKVLLAITMSGYTARMMARFHPDKIIVAATPSGRAAREMALIRGVYPVITEESADWDQLRDEAVSGARDLGLICDGDAVVISAGLPLNVSGNTNMLKVEIV